MVEEYLRFRSENVNLNDPTVILLIQFADHFMKKITNLENEYKGYVDASK